ncbi:MAG TPA: DUF4350 domain-containing protein [Iamia sp.]|nr:DUF4350 domain-containing protein [Iamia sp.]
MTGWWGRVGPVKRAVAVVLGLVVGVNLLLAALDAVVGSDPGGPTGSSYATGDDGVAAWADLLRARGVTVEPLRRPLGEADLPAGGTVVVVDPADAPTPEGLAALADHLAGGGRVVAVGAAGSVYAGALLGADLGWQPKGTARPTPAGDLLAGLDDLRGDGTGSFATPGPATVEAGPAAAPVVVSTGGLLAVADPSLLHNARLADGDDAALAVVLAGSGPVAFAEAEHGYGTTRGLAAVPGPLKAAVIGLVLAALVGLWSVGQRLGPAEAVDRPLPPPRRAYVDALGAALARTPDPPTPEDTRDRSDTLAR